MDDNNISEKLHVLAKSKNRSATARIREIFDQIEIALQAGVRRKDVHKTLNENGFEITLESFELAIYRIRKERKGGVALPNASQESSSALATTSRAIGIAAEELEKKIGAENVTGCDEVVETFNNKQDTSKYDV